MSNDSDKFHTRDELESRGFTLEGNIFVSAADDGDESPSLLVGEGFGVGGRERYLPLYEAKMMHQFTHRWATYQPNGKTRDMTPAELRDPHVLPLPRYWVDEREVAEKNNALRNDAYVSVRRFGRATDERTVICGFTPPFASGDSATMLAFPETRTSVDFCALSANISAFAFDFAARQKVGGVMINQYILEQLPVIPSHTYTQPLLDFITPRVLELTYTAWDLQPFARDLDYQGAPFIWSEERRFLMRCELDALYFHLYGIERADVDYIMETFPIVKRKDEAAHGEYRTKRVILEMYDQMADLQTMPVPAPKPEHGEIAVPDVSRWVTPLDPPPADARAAHGARPGDRSGQK